MKPEDRERIVSDVVGRILDREMRLAADDPSRLEEVIAETIYHELARLKREKSTPETAKETATLKKLRGRLLRVSETEKRDILKGMIRRFVNEVLGNFSPRVYQLSTRVIPAGLSLLLNALSPKRMLSNLPHLPDFQEQIRLKGEIAQIRSLMDKGTLILTPTHSSNLDSLVVGYSLFALGLPPFVYGAGLNLFANPFLSFFMNNLGAYKVDRKKKAPLYKEVLKEYSTCSLELGYPNLFFPGGTRSRSGAVEQKLKLGLLGCGLRAYINNLRAGKAKPRVYIVPCTLSYEMVLEAETLVDDFLKEKGKNRYIITDDEFSRPRKVLNFIQSLFALDSHIEITFSTALDPLGNRVDMQGNSLDPKGRPIDLARFVHDLDGKPATSAQRDREYTRELGEAVAQAYLRDNVLMSTHLAAYATFSVLVEINDQLSLFKLLRTGGIYESVPVADVVSRLKSLLQVVEDLMARGRVRLDEDLDGLPAEDILALALKYFGSYYSGNPAIERKGNRLFARQMNLLYYYSNRLQGYGINSLLERRNEVGAP